jgi:predicted amidophosphoribosyltransferase
MTQRYCRSCRKPITHRSKGLCHSCAASLSGKRHGKANRITWETAKDKAVRNKTTESFWTKPKPDFAEAARRMAGNGWEV